MNNDGLQAIFLIVSLLIGLAIFCAPLLLFFVYVFFQTSKRKRIRQKVLSGQAQLIANHAWVPVRYASESRFDAWFKIFPWEGAGILLLMPGSVTFLGETNSGAPVNLQFAPGNSTLNWFGKAPFPNGAVSWFDFTTASGRHYFSSETGAFVFGSQRSTKEACDQVSRSFSGTL